MSMLSKRLIQTSSIRFFCHRPDRGSYSSLCDGDVVKFKDLLGVKNVVMDDEELSYANTDWLKAHTGNSKIMLLPKTNDQVQSIVKHCNAANLAICVQGGNTGLVGGSVPVHDEILLNLKKMNKVISFGDGILHCQGGCILQDLNMYLESHNAMMPLDLGAKGSCHIGGNLATNAGGIRFLRYGSLHGSCLGLKVITGKGDQLDLLNRNLRKNNTGYPLHHMFIGSEGTLGVITEAVIACPTNFKSVQVAFAKCASFEEVRAMLDLARNSLSEILSAFELIDYSAHRSVLENLDIKSPFTDTSPADFYILIETHGSDENHDAQKVDNFLQSAFSEDLITDGILASNRTQQSDLWRLREEVALAANSYGFVYKYDVSLPLTHYYEVVHETRRRMTELGFYDGETSSDKPIKAIMGYGHLGDGNVHLNVACDQAVDGLGDILDEAIFDWVSKHNGSISAEHGIGQHKRPYLHLNQTEQAIEMMKNVKALFDPKAILNPYKTIPN